LFFDEALELRAELHDELSKFHDFCLKAELLHQISGDGILMFHIIAIWVYG
jgi:hypothetical protein